MYKVRPLKQRIRYVYEENIYFSAKQICAMLAISNSCLSKQLKKVVDIPGCEADRFWSRRGKEESRYKGQHLKLRKYNMNTVAAVAYRVNNESCKYFLSLYHRALRGMQLRLSGANYYVPTEMTIGEFAGLVSAHMPHLEIDCDDS